MPLKKLSRNSGLFGCLLGLVVTSLTLPAQDRPNIIYIMADDMGYSDIGCYGSEIETPHLDSLAENGLRFTQFYNTARCCPTRASLLSGLYPHQAGVGHMMSDSGHDGYRGELNRECVTIAEVLKTAGYRTYMSGKWHVTQHIQPESGQQQSNWPCQRGFDRFYGTIHGAGSFYDPNSLARDNQLISPYADDEYQPEDGFYYTDAIADHAVRFVREHHQHNREDPFFLYVSFTAAHWPMHAREKDIDKYVGRYSAGYDSIRQARYQRMLELGVVTEHNTRLWEMGDVGQETEHLDWDLRNMEVYAAMIDCMDRGIGRLVNSLRENGQLDNTLILYFQDNGGCAENYGRGEGGQPRSEHPTLDPLADSYLQPDMEPKQTRDGYPVRKGKGVMAGPADTYIGYGKAWATVSNTPFREYKHWVHEGGISSPLIAHWPAGISRPGELEDQPSHLIDLMATAVDLGSADYPSEFHGGNKIQPMEGISLKPLFQGQAIQRDALYWEHEGNRAIRVGDWKLVAKGTDSAWELYDLASDRSEQNDLADKFPERVMELADKWQRWAERARVLPLTPYRNNNQKLNKSQLEFQPAQNKDLPRHLAPFVKGRNISFAADLSEVADGVLVAQGGGTHGWAIHIQDATLILTLCKQSQRHILRSSHVSGAGRVEATIRKDGTAELRWNGELIAQGEVGGPLTEQPQDGLQIGRDLQGAVGDYKVPFAFTGKIDAVEIKLSK